jgi:hypothetical protein
VLLVVGLVGAEDLKWKAACNRRYRALPIRPDWFAWRNCWSARAMVESWRGRERFKPGPQVPDESPQPAFPPNAPDASVPPEFAPHLGRLPDHREELVERLPDLPAIGRRGSAQDQVRGALFRPLLIDLRMDHAVGPSEMQLRRQDPMSASRSGELFLGAAERPPFVRSPPAGFAHGGHPHRGSI